ncbi:MAG: flagellin FliC [Bdellovibrionaceae bacterium]|nr:flagellin FliC [Pseudobdellovibrionaceae bacterium]
MSLRIATNVPSLSARKALEGNQKIMDKSMSQLSSGSRITKAADDAAGLSISEGMKSQIRSYGQALRNTNDGVSLLQVAEGSLGEISNIFTRMRELGIQAASDTIGDDERGFINQELSQLKSEVDRIAESTTYGSKKLLNGEGGQFDFQVGINGSGESDIISYDSGEANATTSSLGVDGIDYSSKDGAKDALSTLDDAQKQVNGFRANLGAMQNRLGSTTENLGTQIENLSIANSRIRDADIAESSAEYTKSNILLNATTNVLAQANEVPRQALRLLG